MRSFRCLSVAFALIALIVASPSFAEKKDAKAASKVAVLELTGVT